MEFAEGYPDRQEEDCRGFLARFPLVLPEPGIAWQASRLLRELRGAGSPIGDHDIWIAATALERSLPLVTRDARHFRRIRDLAILTY